MLFSQVGRIGASRLVPVMSDVEAVEAADQPGDEEDRDDDPDGDDGVGAARLGNWVWETLEPM